MLPCVMRDVLIRYRIDLEGHLLVAQRDTWQDPPLPAGLEIFLVDAGSPAELIRESMDVNERGFDPAAAEVDLLAAEAFRPSLIGCAAVTARWEGQPVATGMFNPIREGVAELVGIATLEPFRGRGFGGAVTARLARAAFDAGAHAVFLTTTDPKAAGVYRRAGFRDA
jgi:GNAT superfamily N-acetyltransferase